MAKRKTSAASAPHAENADAPTKATGWVDVPADFVLMIREAFPGAEIVECTSVSADKKTIVCNVDGVPVKFKL